MTDQPQDELQRSKVLVGAGIVCVAVAIFHTMARVYRASEFHLADLGLIGGFLSLGAFFLAPQVAQQWVGSVFMFWKRDGTPPAAGPDEE